ncbi:MAG: type II toxin-antitoxin system HicA family toxin [Gammaproteobacteria bacterium]|nr:type II toxin-antitoxin system HicA family toxin [Gammaproteobacteria bacterium]
MPRKIRELARLLEKAGFRRKSGKYIHPDGRQLVLSGKDGDDAKPYQERQVMKRV